jgi:hypothetical protein
MTTQKTAKLRVCASCEWIFTKNADTATDGCPMCAFGHYGARYVYGDAAYRYAKTQQKWLDNKILIYERKLRNEISYIQSIGTKLNF